MKQLKAIRPALALLVSLGSVLPAQAVAVDVIFSGNLVVPPPCEINSDNAISVVFGNDMLTERVDGVNYEKTIAYTLDCNGATSTALKLQFQGAGTVFDASVLATSMPALGLELRSDGVKLPLNTWINFTDPTRPVLTAVPVKGNKLNGGVFTATSTLVVDYQ
ncbi:fimbrial protein [Serratia sp. L9]|uniref:fimbrial protein n=1 Tax=Serratia sp. L9 TaxID=3423946 RepID=UPI003D6790FB